MLREDQCPALLAKSKVTHRSTATTTTTTSSSSSSSSSCAAAASSDHNDTNDIRADAVRFQVRSNW